MKHHAMSKFLHSCIEIWMVGAGGNGAQMLTGLARLHLAMKACGHPYGIKVRLFDPDVVTHANVGRQLFYSADTGLFKAAVLMHRVNLCYGLQWTAHPIRFQAPESLHRCDLLITCVDSAASRREIHQQIWEVGYKTPFYWLDLGNRAQDGQVIFGQPVAWKEQYQDRVQDPNGALNPNRLPCVTEIFPELLDATIPEDDKPSCSLAESLEKQDLFINDHVSRWALHLLWTLFRRGAIEYHGYFVNLQSGSVNPLPVRGGEK